MSRAGSKGIDFVEDFLMTEVGKPYLNSLSGTLGYQVLEARLRLLQRMLDTLERVNSHRVSLSQAKGKKTIDLFQKKIEALMKEYDGLKQQLKVAPNPYNLEPEDLQVAEAKFTRQYRDFLQRLKKLDGKE